MLGRTRIVPRSGLYGNMGSVKMTEIPLLPLELYKARTLHEITCHDP